MAFYMDESQLYKCPKHPSRRRRSGICAKCLRDRLVILCPDCAAARPCHCCPPPAALSSSSSTSSGSFSFLSFSRTGSRRDFGTVNGESSRLSNNLESNPTLRKSRSVVVSLFRSRTRYGGTETGDCDNSADLLPKVSRSKINFWSVFTVNKSKKCDLHVDSGNDELGLTGVDDNHNPVMMRSRSVAVGSGNGYAPATVKQKGPGTVKGFRHSKPPRSVAVA